MTEGGRAVASGLEPGQAVATGVEGGRDHRPISQCEHCARSQVLTTVNLVNRDTGALREASMCDRCLGNDQLSWNWSWTVA